MKSGLFCFVLLTLTSACAQSGVLTPELGSCDAHPELLSRASAELQKLVRDDQADRQGPNNAIDWSQVSPRDLDRRVRVATLFAEGCLREGKDYAAAAMIYQHGDGPDHPFQAFLWGVTKVFPVRA